MTPFHKDATVKLPCTKDQVKVFYIEARSAVPAHREVDIYGVYVRFTCPECGDVHRCEVQ